MFKINKLRIFLFFVLIFFIAGIIAVININGKKNRNIDTVFTYIAAIKQITRENEKFYDIVNPRVQRSVKTRDKEKAKAILEEIDVFLNKTIDKLKKMTPPRALKKYHRYILQSYEYRRRANLAYFYPVKEEYVFCNDMSAASYAKSLKELNKIYIMFNAPQDRKDEIMDKMKELEKR